MQLSFITLCALYVLVLHISCINLCESENIAPIGDGQCIWYDQCMRNPEKKRKWLNCAYNGTAKPFPKESTKRLFKETCPELAEEIQETEGDIVTCCSTGAIQTTTVQLRQLYVILKNCPACYSNLRKNFCYFACHPRHSAFLQPTKVIKSRKGEDAILTVTQYSSYTYIDATYDSCDSVYFPLLNKPAMSILCGPWGDEHCTPERLFDYFGNNDFAPFNISYVYSNENTTVTSIYDNVTEIDMQPFNSEVIPCNTEDVEMQCNCVDCEESCADPPQPIPPPERIEVGEVWLYTVIIALLYGIFALGFLVFAYFKGLPGNFKETTKCCSFNHRLSAIFEETLQTCFRKFASGIAYHPYFTLTAGFVVIGVLSLGIMDIKMTTDPVELWASPESRTRKEKEYFDNNFGPFYRTNQIIITSVGLETFNNTIDVTGGGLNYTFGPVFNSSFMLAIMDMQLEIMDLVAEFDGKNITLNDVCIKPLSPLNDECLIQSIMNYWQNDKEKLKAQMFDDNGEETLEYTEHLITCVSNPSYVAPKHDITCLGTYGGPVFPYVALGGYLKEGESLAVAPRYEESEALVITFLNENSLDDEKLGPSLAWEKVFMEYLLNYKNELMDIAYYSERGIEDEIIRQGKGDISTIFISYLVMFAYVTITLGRITSDCNRLFIDSKIMLGLCSVLLVFLSVISSVGFCALFGIEGTLFVIEVIPFLVLAVGVDNIFLLVQTWQREKRLKNESVENHVARVVGKVAPSMLIATSSEAICFFLGALSQMPAVHAFAIYGGVALTIDFLLQITCLVALIVIDAKRASSNRYDVLCCIKGSKGKKQTDNKEDVCLSFFRSVYVPFLLKDAVRVVVVLLFTGAFAASCAFIPKMDIGLEQDIGMPDDSFVLKYFDYMGKYLSVGSPIYFVVTEGFDFPDIDEQNLICQSKGCRNDSILSQIFWASRSPDVTNVATGASSWLDDYLTWVTDTGGMKESSACCRLDADQNFINTSESNAKNTDRTCLNSSQIDRETKRPKPEYFMEFLPYFLIDNPHEFQCPQAGHPGYGAAVVIESNDKNKTSVGGSYFMAYHSILKKSNDFSTALERVFELTDTMTQYLRNESGTPDVEVFPYSIFYVYYEQYLTMWRTAAESLGISLLAVFLVMTVLSGFDIRSALINLTVIVMIVADIMALMIPWNIQLNAISLVNLVMAIGISVEFCNHVTHTFATSAHDMKIERAAVALTYTGSSVLAGITLTKFAGIIVLAFAQSQVIKVYYFRMYLMIVVLGALHGLMFLPVLLSLIGPSTNQYLVSESEDNADPTPIQFINLGFDAAEPRPKEPPKIQVNSKSNGLISFE